MWLKATRETFHESLLEPMESWYFFLRTICSATCREFWIMRGTEPWLNRISDSLSEERAAGCMGVLTAKYPRVSGAACCQRPPRFRHRRFLVRRAGAWTLGASHCSICGAPFAERCANAAMCKSVACGLGLSSGWMNWMRGRLAAGVLLPTACRRATLLRQGLEMDPHGWTQVYPLVVGLHRFLGVIFFLAVSALPKTWKLAVRGSGSNLVWVVVPMMYAKSAPGPNPGQKSTCSVDAGTCIEAIDVIKPAMQALKN